MNGEATARMPRIAVALVAAVGLLSTLYFGCFDVDRAYVLFDLDCRAWFVAGVAWWRGESPYELEVFVRTWADQFNGQRVRNASCVFSPTVLPLSLLLGALPWDVARWTMRGINLTCFLGSILVLRHLLVIRLGDRATVVARELWIALALGLPATALTLYQGQLSLIAAAGLCLTWAGMERRSTGWLIAGMVMASIKPQATLVPLLFLIALHRDRKVWWGIAASVALGSCVMLWSSPMQLFIDLAQSLREHMTQEFNQPECYNSIPALFGTTRLARAAAVIGILVGCGVAARLGFKASRSSSLATRLRLFQISVALASATMPIHRYDLTIDVILVATGWALGSARRGLVLVGLVFIHGKSFWFGRHLHHRVLPDMPHLQFLSHTASLFGAVVLSFLLWCWFQDRSRVSASNGKSPSI